MLAELAALRKHGLKKGFADGFDDFMKQDLLTYSSAIAFQILYAVVPLALLGLSGLGLFGLRSVYTAHIAPTMRHDLSHDSFAILNRTALRVMGSKRLWWATIGLLITVWGISASLRAMMNPLNRVYGARETRSWKNRLAVSLAGGVLVMVSLFSAILIVLGGRLVHPPGIALSLLFFIGRWVVTFALLLLTIAVIIRVVPAKKRPAEWVSVGSVICAVCWIVASIAFAAYISAVSYASFYGAFASIVILLIVLGGAVICAVCWIVASIAFAAYISAVSYASFYGAFASIVILLIYLHAAAVAFLIGVVADAQLRKLVERS